MFELVFELVLDLVHSQNGLLLVDWLFMAELTYYPQRSRLRRAREDEFCMAADADTKIPSPCSGHQACQPVELSDTPYKSQ